MLASRSINLLTHATDSLVKAPKLAFYVANIKCGVCKKNLSETRHGNIPVAII